MLRAFLAVLMGAAVTACGFGLLVVGTDSTASLTSTPCTNQATAEAIRPKFRVPDTEIQCRIRRALLQPDDLGSNWEDALEDGLSDSVPAYSVGNCRIPPVGFQSGLRTMLQRDSGGENPDAVVIEQVLVFGPGAANDYMEAVRASCTMLQGAALPEDDAPLISEVPFAFTVYGDETVALRVDLEAGEDPAISVTAFNILVRRGDVVLSLVVTDTTAEGNLLERVVDAADARMAAIQPILHGSAVPGEYIAPTANPGTLKSVLASGLFSAADLGPGWLRTSTLSSVRRGLCDEDPLSGLASPFRAVGAQYASGHSGWFGQRMFLYLGNDAQSMMDALIRSWSKEDRCTSTYVDIADERETYVYDVELRPLDVGDYGDQTAALEARFDADGRISDFVVRLVYVRRGGVIGAISQAMETSQVDEEVTRRLARLLDEKVAELASALETEGSAAHSAR
ncbi:MAG: hypothetical protein HY873_13430 [Chloroflexi bacterium]|nr:hypothetical protein [Chloroflexota bacterium]